MNVYNFHVSPFSQAFQQLLLTEVSTSIPCQHVCWDAKKVQEREKQSSADVEVKK